VNDPPPPIRKVRPGLPAGVDAVLRQALAKEPGARYPSVTAFVDALTAALAGKKVRGARKRAMAPPPIVPAAITEADETVPAQTPAEDRRAPVWLWALAALLGVALVVAGFLVLRDGPTPSPTATAVAAVASSTRPPTREASVTAPAATQASQSIPARGQGNTGAEPTATLAPTNAPTATGAPSSTASATRRAPTAAPTASRRPTSTPTPTRTATRFPTPTDTREPARTPTQTPPSLPGQYAAPALLAPADGQGFTTRDTITLEWESVGELEPDAYYEVVVAFSPVENPAVTWTDETPWGKRTSWTLSEHDYLPHICADGMFHWSVRVMYKTGENAEGRPVGQPLSPMSAARTLVWQPPSEGGEGGPEGPVTREPEPPPGG
jgi:hypothetical protein